VVSSDGGRGVKYTLAGATNNKKTWSEPQDRYRQHTKSIYDARTKSKDTQQRTAKCGGRCALECAWHSHQQIHPLSQQAPDRLGPAEAGGPRAARVAWARRRRAAMRSRIARCWDSTSASSAARVRLPACSEKNIHTHQYVQYTHDHAAIEKSTAPSDDGHPTPDITTPKSGTRATPCQLRTLLKQSEPLRRLPVVPLSTTAAPAPTAGALAAAAGSSVSVPRPRGTWRGTRAPNAACTRGRRYADTQACRHAGTVMLHVCDNHRDGMMASRTVSHPSPSNSHAPVLPTAAAEHVHMRHTLQWRPHPLPRVGKPDGHL
jgi:hypothetical protein